MQMCLCLPVLAMGELPLKPTQAMSGKKNRGEILPAPQVLLTLVSGGLPFVRLILTQ